MKSLGLFFFMFILITPEVLGQKLEVDIFNDLQYKSEDQNYTATFEKDIFDNLTFSDNKKNEIKMEKEYLNLYYPEILHKNKIKIDLFYDLIDEYKDKNGYKATYSIDIFDKVVIEDNQNNKTVINKDIFGNKTYEGNNKGMKSSIRRDFNGDILYESTTESASLKKDIFNKWTYKDSTGNIFEFSSKTWENLKDKYGSEEDILYYLIKQYLGY